jgi:adenylate cyclase
LRLALSIDENDPDILATVGFATSFLTDDFNTASEMVDRAVALNPNSAHAWNHRGQAYLLGGQCAEAVRSFERGIRLSPLDPYLYMSLAGMGFGLIELRRFGASTKRPRQGGRRFGKIKRLRRLTIVSHQPWATLDVKPKCGRWWPVCWSLNPSFDFPNG